MGRKSLKKLMEEVSKRKDISEEEKESLMAKIRKLDEERDELRAEIESPKKLKKSLKKLMEEVSKRKDIPEEEKESLMAKIRKLDEEKDELVAEIEGQEKKKKIPEIVDSGKEKHNEEELQTLRSRVDELQIEVGRIQKENNELKVELNWRRTHKYADDITLNPDTAHPNLSISKDKKFTHEAQPQKVLPTPERFDSTVCVLGCEGFSSGKHYWEVDVRNSTDWDLGVARKSIERKGKLSLCPTKGFWVLVCSRRDYWAKTVPWTPVIVQKKPKKIGVYLSYQEGLVTFFNVTDMSVLFTFNDCSFSGEVYPFFKNSHKETSMRICSIRKDE